MAFWFRRRPRVVFCGKPYNKQSWLGSNVSGNCMKERGHKGSCGPK